MVVQKVGAKVGLEPHSPYLLFHLPQLPSLPPTYKAQELPFGVKPTCSHILELESLPCLLEGKGPALWQEAGGKDSIPLALSQPLRTERMWIFQTPLDEAQCQWQRSDLLLMAVCFLLPIKGSWARWPPVQHPRLPCIESHCFQPPPFCGWVPKPFL